MDVYEIIFFDFRKSKVLTKLQLHSNINITNQEIHVTVINSVRADHTAFCMAGYCLGALVLSELSR